MRVNNGTLASTLSRLLSALNSQNGVTVLVSHIVGSVTKMTVTFFQSLFFSNLPIRDACLTHSVSSKSPLWKNVIGSGAKQSMRNERPVTTSSLENPEIRPWREIWRVGVEGRQKQQQQQQKQNTASKNKTKQKKVEEGRVGSTRSALNRDLK